jgi:hypothetical protein
MWFLCIVGVNPLSSGKGLVCFVRFDLVLNAAYFRIVFFRLKYVLIDFKLYSWNLLTKRKLRVKLNYNEVVADCGERSNEKDI